MSHKLVYHNCTSGNSTSKPGSRQFSPCLQYIQKCPLQSSTQSLLHLGILAKCKGQFDSLFQYVYERVTGIATSCKWRQQQVPSGTEEANRPGYEDDQQNPQYTPQWSTVCHFYILRICNNDFTLHFCVYIVQISKENMLTA